MSTHAENAPGWSDGPRRSSLPINGELMRELRRARSLTQEQLAALAGYSPRLIRKAEAGLPIKADTVEIIAEALSTPEAPLSPETLASDLRSLVQAFAVAYAFDERQLATTTKSIWSPGITYKMAGDPNLIPFAGEYHGIAGVDHWAKDLFSTIERPIKEIYRPVLYQAGATILAVGHDAVRIPGEQEITYSMTVLQFEFERGRIVCVDNDYDTHGAVELLQRHRAKQAARGDGTA